MFRGFRQLRDTLAGGAVDLASVRSPAEVLAAVLGRPQLENQFTLYMSSLGAGNASLLQSLPRALAPDEVVEKKGRLLAYVLGHVLANAVLRYPGPILSDKALCAYVGTTDVEAAALAGVFSEARYDGPFSIDVDFYWRADVDRVIDRRSTAVETETSAELLQIAGFLAALTSLASRGTSMKSGHHSSVCSPWPIAGKLSASRTNSRGLGRKYWAL